MTDPDLEKKIDRISKRATTRWHELMVQENLIEKVPLNDTPKIRLAFRALLEAMVEDD